MKIATASTASAQSSSDDTHKFQISANGTAFQILSSGLYSNKIQAVLRELSCNAADAHVAAGKASVPIEVLLPTLDDPKLTIRDHGPGLSHEQVLSLYTTYFSSNKRDSNAFVGGLGLGSKSPFAYTNAFTVQSIHQGVKRLYSCNIGDDGGPTVTKLHEEATDAPSGMEVSLLTLPRDRARFLHEAGNLYQWFDVRPVLNTQPHEVVFDTNPVRFDCPAYAVRTYNNPMLVKMGNVVYPLSLSDIGVTHDHPLLALCSYIPLVLKSPIGHLQVAASREALQYDPATKKHALQLLQLAYHDIANRLMVAMNAPTNTTPWRKETAVLEWAAQHLPANQASASLIPLLSQIGTPDATSVSTALSNPTAKIPTMTGNVTGSNVYWYDQGLTTRKNVDAGTVSIGTSNGSPQYGPASLSKLEHTCIVVADDKHINEKIGTWRKMHHSPSMLLISPTGKNHLAAAREHADRIAATMSGVPVFLLSELPVHVHKTANVVKRDFVEIEDRPMQVLNLFTGKVTTQRFGDVPDTMRYLLIKNTEAPSKEVQYFIEDGVTSKQSWNLSALEKSAPFFAWLRDHAGVPWIGPEGCLLVRPVDVQRMKLQDLPLYAPSILTAATSPENDAIRKAGESLWENDQKDATWHGYNRMYERTSGWIGDFAGVAQAKNKKSALVKSLLREANEWPLIELRQHVPTTEEAGAYQAYVHLRRMLAAQDKAKAAILPEPYSNQKVREQFIARHPMAAYVNTNAVRQWMDGSNKVSDAHMEMMLRAVLGI